MSKVDIMSTIYIKFHGTSSVQYFFRRHYGGFWLRQNHRASEAKETFHLCIFVVQVELSLADTSTCVIWKDGRRTCDENIVVHTTTMGCRCLISKLVRRNLDTINLERGSTPNQICSLLGRVKINCLTILTSDLGSAIAVIVWTGLKNNGNSALVERAVVLICVNAVLPTVRSRAVRTTTTQRHAGGKTGRTNWIITLCHPCKCHLHI